MSNNGVIVYQAEMEEMAAQSREMIDKQQAVFNAMPPALRTACKCIRTCMATMAENSLRQIWELGKLLTGYASDTSGKLGSDPIAKISEAEGIDRGYLFKIAHFYRDFPVELLEWTLKQRMKESRRMITWTHIQQIVSVESVKDRKLFLQKTFENEWTPEQLFHAIHKHSGKQIRGGGRPLKIPRHLEGKLDNMGKILSVFLRNDKAIWRHDEHGILSAITDMPPDKVTPLMIEKIDKGIELANQAREAVSAEVTMLRKAREMAEKRLQSQAKQQVDGNGKEGKKPKKPAASKGAT